MLSVSGPAPRSTPARALGLSTIHHPSHRFARDDVWHLVPAVEFTKRYGVAALLEFGHDAAAAAISGART